MDDILFSFIFCIGTYPLVQYPVHHALYLTIPSLLALQIVITDFQNDPTIDFNRVRVKAQCFQNLLWI